MEKILRWNPKHSSKSIFKWCLSTSFLLSQLSTTGSRWGCCGPLLLCSLHHVVFRDPDTRREPLWSRCIAVRALHMQNVPVLPFPHGNHPGNLLWLACRFWFSHLAPSGTVVTIWGLSTNDLRPEVLHLDPRALWMSRVVNHCQQHISVCLGAKLRECFPRPFWEITSKCWEILKTLQHSQN